MQNNQVTAKQLAELIGVSQAAITKGISTGRLSESIISKGKEGYIIDTEKAFNEWENNRQRKPSMRPTIDELEANAEPTGDYPKQQESIQRKENAQAEIASIRLQGLTRDRYEWEKVEKIVLEAVPEEEKIKARRVLNEFRELVKKKYR